MTDGYNPDTDTPEIGPNETIVTIPKRRFYFFPGRLTLLLLNLITAIFVGGSVLWFIIWPLFWYGVTGEALHIITWHVNRAGSFFVAMIVLGLPSFLMISGLLKKPVAYYFGFEYR